MQHGLNSKGRTVNYTRQPRFLVQQPHPPVVKGALSEWHACESYMAPQDNWAYSCVRVCWRAELHAVNALVVTDQHLVDDQLVAMMIKLVCVLLAL